MSNSKQKITVKVLVKKPKEEVWTYFTRPEHIIHWNFASFDWHCPSAKNELKPGGRFSYTMASKDGKFQFDFCGTFKDVFYLKYISYKLDDGRFVEINFDEMPKGTLITETFEPENVFPVELQRLGWKSILKNFKHYVENL